MAKEKRKSKFAGKVTGDAQKQKSKGAQYGYLQLPKGVSVFKEDAGKKTKLDFIPYIVSASNHPDRDDELEIALPGEQWYKRPYKLHRNVGSENASAVCPTSIGKKCPICEFRLKRVREGAEKEEIKLLKPSDRNMYVVIPKGSKDHDEKPHIWDISQFLFQEMLNEELEENPDNGVFPDLEEGKTLRIRFSEEKIGKNAFASTSRIDFEDRDDQYDESILKKSPCLDDVLIVLSYEELRDKFYEVDSEDDKDEKEEEKETQSRKKKSVKEEKEDDDEPDEKEEKTSRKKREQEDDDDDDNSKNKKSNKQTETEEEDCVACEGAGKNSKGKDCPICQGTGIRPKAQRRGKEEEKKKSNKCPYDHKFGEDCEEYTDCDDCDEWKACLKKRDE